MCLHRPPLALLPVLLLLGALGVGMPLATASPSWPPLRPPPPPSYPVPIEVDPSAPTCDGLWAHSCEEGLRCVDNPADSCDPRQGNSDCPGLCVASETPPVPASCWTQDPARRYVSHEPALCSLLLFSCGLEEQPFFNTCGCGCERTH